MCAKPRGESVQFFVRAARLDPDSISQVDIDRMWLALVEEFSRLLAQFSAKLALLVAAETDEKKVQQIIRREVRRLRREFNATKHAMIDSIATTQL